MKISEPLYKEGDVVVERYTLIRRVSIVADMKDTPNGYRYLCQFGEDEPIERALERNIRKI